MISLLVLLAYLACGAATAVWQHRALPHHPGMQDRYTYLAYALTARPRQVAACAAVVGWPLIVTSVLLWGWPKDGAGHGPG